MSRNLINAEKPSEQIPFEKIDSIHGRSKIVADYSSYIIDESKLTGTADWLFFPQSEPEIISILNFLQKNKIRASISAARTGIVGSCVPSGDSILSIEQMNKIIGVGFDKNKKSYFIRVQPGVTLDNINDFLKKKKTLNVRELTSNAIKLFQESNQTFYYPVDPTELSATIGGTVATNAS
ncbi:MAG: FAD-binding oxidoreductase, partial [Promethearchaeota archaeon]